jgi:FkbM family methyltransferase
MSSKRVFFQIGANNGDDDFRKYAQEHNPDLIILVEPNTSHADSIKERYSSMKNVCLYTKAIYYESNTTVDLVIPSKNGKYGEKADNGIVYTDVHYSLVPMNDWGSKDDMVSLKVETITFDDICKCHNITEIEFLQIDTEGFDSEIIRMIDLSKYKIHNIKFEKWNFNTECFTKYNENNSTNLGINGMNLCFEKLKHHNYEIKDDGHDYIATLKNVK